MSGGEGVGQQRDEPVGAEHADVYAQPEKGGRVGGGVKRGWQGWWLGVSGSTGGGGGGIGRFGELVDIWQNSLQSM